MSWFDQVKGGTPAPVADPDGFMAWQQQERQMNQGGPLPTQIGGIVKGPQNQPPMSLEQVQRWWNERQNDPNIIREHSGSGNFQQVFQQIMGGLPATPENLIAKEQELRAAGIEVRRNAAGTAGKIGIIGQPDQIFDVIANAEGGGGGNWQWNYAPPGSRGGASPGMSLGSLGGGPNYGARQGALAQTPGYQFRLKQGIEALDRSASAKGTLLNGGYKKDLMEFAQGLASTEYDREFGRNQTLADLGLRAAGAQGAYGTSYGDQITDLTTGAANAQAAGTAASGNAWGSTLGNLGNLGMQAGLYKWLQPKPYSGLDYE